MAQNSTFHITRYIYLRTLAIIFIIAFTSLLLQIEGLYGANGILPIEKYLGFARVTFENAAFFNLPTLFWLSSSNSILIIICSFGLFASLLALIGVFEIATFLIAFIAYFSFVIVGQTFLSYQWDILLIETGFLALFIASFKARSSLKNSHSPSFIILLIIWLLLFRLMFSSGVIKLISNDKSWWELTALNYHYYTQPIPNRLAYYMHQLPTWFQNTSVAFMFFVELIVPFGIFCPRKVRHLSAVLLILLQVLILLTGNFTFFNLLTIALCLFLFDDQFFRNFLFLKANNESSKQAEPKKLVKYLIRAVAVLLIVLSISTTFTSLSGIRLGPITTLQTAFRRYFLVNSYGLFAVMTTSRPELIIEGSMDGKNWQEYEFYWKPGRLDKAPSQVAPHQPRIDWQMWFAALKAERGARYNKWLYRFLEKLMQAEPAVLKLIEVDPFQGNKPEYVRVLLYDYKFTSPSDSENWWKRELKTIYLGPFSLKN